MANGKMKYGIIVIIALLVLAVSIYLLYSFLEKNKKEGEAKYNEEVIKISNTISIAYALYFLVYSTIYRLWRTIPLSVVIILSAILFVGGVVVIYFSYILSDTEGGIFGLTSRTYFLIMGSLGCLFAFFIASREILRERRSSNPYMRFENIGNRDNRNRVSNRNRNRDNRVNIPNIDTRMPKTPKVPEISGISNNINSNNSSSMNNLFIAVILILIGGPLITSIIYAIASDTLDLIGSIIASVVICFLIYLLWGENIRNLKNVRNAVMFMFTLLILASYIAWGVIRQKETSDYSILIIFVHLLFFIISWYVVYKINWDSKENLYYKARRKLRGGNIQDPDENLTEFLRVLNCIDQRVTTQPEIFKNMELMRDQPGGDRVIELYNKLNELIEFKKKYPTLLSYEVKPEAKYFQRVFGINSGYGRNYR